MVKAAPKRNRTLSPNSDAKKPAAKDDTKHSLRSLLSQPGIASKRLSDQTTAL